MGRDSKFMMGTVGTIPIHWLVAVAMVYALALAPSPTLVAAAPGVVASAASSGTAMSQCDNWELCNTSAACDTPCLADLFETTCGEYQGGIAEGALLIQGVGWRRRFLATAVVVSSYAGVNGLGASRLQVLPPEPLAILLEDYRIGDADAAVATLAAWPPEQVNTQSAELLATGIDTRKRVALVMLHTEAGLLRDDLGTVAGFGRFGGWERSQPLGHFDALYQQAVGGVEHLIAVSPTDPSLVAFLRDWHALVGSRLPLTAGYLAADRFPRDALSLLVSGIIRARMVTFEYPGRGRAYFINSAHPREITQLLNREWPSSFTKVSSGRIMSTGTVQQAEYLFRQALTLDPALVEAELRLGHLLQLADRPREAERAYRAVLERATGDDRGYSGYLAALFLGQVLQARQEWAPALEAYELAVQLRPDARSARMAIANLHVVTGRPDVAWQTAAALLTPPIDGTATDPLTLFHQGQTSRHDQLLAALRAYVRLP